MDTSKQFHLLIFCTFRQCSYELEAACWKSECLYPQTQPYHKPENIYVSAYASDDCFVCLVTTLVSIDTTSVSQYLTQLGEKL